MINTPNPLQPQGALQKPLTDSKTKVVTTVSIIFILHAAVLMGALVQGCQRDSQNPLAQPTNSGDMLPPMDNFYGDARELPRAPAPIADTPAYPETNLTPGNIADSNGGSTPLPSIGGDEPRLDLSTPSVEEATAATTTAGASMPASVAETTGGEYKIRSGDTFSGIAVRHKVKLDALIRANPSVDPRRMRIGQAIVIPGVATPSAPTATPTASTGSSSATSETSATTAYKVQPGDNLTRIARKYDTTVDRIKRANNMRSDRLQIGQQLTIPAP